MYLIENSLFNLSKRQYFFKLKANFGLFFSLILVHIFAILLTMNGLSSALYSGSGITVNISYYSGNIVIIFTLIWAFIVSSIIASNKTKNIDFTFISNRLSSNISNVGFLITLSVYASLITSLSSNFIRVLVYFLKSNQNIVREGLLIPKQYFLINTISLFFYILLISSIGYCIASIIQLNRVSVIFFSCLVLLGIIFIFKINSYKESYSSIYNTIRSIFNFYFNENSFALFIVKALITSLIFFLTSLLITNKMEVKK